MSAELRTSYDAALRGEIERARSARARLDRTRERDRAWAAALDALIAFATGRASDEALAEQALARLEVSDAAARSIAAIACGHVARARALAFDAAGLEAAHARMEQITEGLGSAEALGHRDVVRAWVSVFRGTELDADLEGVVKQATRDGRAELALEAMALRALDALAGADVEAALVLSRRASRMGRTESIPLFEHLVNVVLARVRRVTGQPHLATRILSALLAVCSAPFRPWIVFELALSRGEGAAVAAEIPGSSAPRALDRALGAAWSGDVAAFDAAISELSRTLSACALFARDVGELRAAIDPRVPVPEWLAPFARGEAHEPPFGLAGLADPALGRSGHIAWVIASREGGGRRVLAPGTALARSVYGASVIDERGVSLRTDSAVAMLALAGPAGIAEDVFFRRLYGFDYEPERHQSVRGVLYARMRKRLEPVATLVRSGGTLMLAHDAPLLAADPRCTPRAEVGILRVLAERRRAPPKEIAAALGIPLRTAQELLKRLHEDGAVRAERASRGLHYVLEDTTFSEPTRTLQSGGG